MTAHHPDNEIITALADLADEAPATLPNKVFARWISTPSRLGEVYVAFTDAGVQFLRLADTLHGDAQEFTHAYRARFGRPLQPTSKVPAGVRSALLGRQIRSLDLDLSCLSEFERSVLTATRRIPTGQTRPYGWVAREAANPKAARAVGSVLARNPVPLLVPCHRVVRADGMLGEYVFGADQKEALLRAENANLDEVVTLARQGIHYLASDTTGIVCFPTCRDARRITPAHRREFATIAKAITAGYRPCRTCRPAA